MAKRKINNQETLKKAQAVCKGYEDGLTLCKRAPLADYLYFNGFFAEMATRAHVEDKYFEHYHIGMNAAWDEKHPRPSIRDDMFPQSESSYTQALMRDLEQS